MLYSPSHILALAAFIVAVIAETGRIPVDNPDTHLELTMIHEGMLLEYSGRYLALMEGRTMSNRCSFSRSPSTYSFLPALPIPRKCSACRVDWCVRSKDAFPAVAMALIESTRAKLRFFQLPSLLGGAFILALLSLVTFIMMGEMTNWIQAFSVIDFISAGILLTAVLMNSLKRIEPCVKAYTLNSWLLSALTAVVAFMTGEAHLYAASAVTFLSKGVLIPLF